MPIEFRLPTEVFSGHGAAIDTTTAAGKLVFGIFAALAEFERELIKERTVGGGLGLGSGQGKARGPSVQDDNSEAAAGNGRHGSA